MFIPQSYALAVALCVITMLCWGSWANTQKLASRKWSFQLFYWDYTIGIILLTLILGFTLGSSGEAGRSFLTDLGQGSSKAYASAFIGGIIFSIAAKTLTQNRDRRLAFSKAINGGLRGHFLQYCIDFVVKVFNR